MSLMDYNTPYELAISQPPLISPLGVAAIAAVVLTAAFLLKTLSVKAVMATAVPTAILTAVSVTLSFALRVAYYHLVSVAITSITASLVLFARSQVKDTQLKRGPSATDISDSAIAFYHRNWLGRTEMEAQNETDILGDHYRIASNNVKNTESLIRDLELEVAPMGRTERRVQIESKLVELRSKLNHYIQVQLNHKDTYATIQAALADAKNNDVFAESTSLKDFVNMGLSVKGAAAARGQHHIKSTYGEHTFNIIMAAVRGQPQDDIVSPNTSVVKHRAASTPRL